jgi:tetratricopeptide (TPR) repeat protein
MQLPVSGSAFSNALRIARMIHDERLVAKLLAMHGMGKGASEADLVAVIEAHEAAGAPQLAVGFLRLRLRQYPNERKSLLLLARLFARNGQSRDAAAAWHEYVERFGFDALSTDDVVRYARDLSRSGDVDAAYRLLLRQREAAAEDAATYWTDLATLAWERDDSDMALVAYEHVYRLDPSTLHAGTRLMTLFANAKRKEEAVDIAMREYERAADANAARFAAHLLATDGDWAGVWAVIVRAERKPSVLPTYADWLLLKGDTAKHLGNLHEATKAYAAALALAPNDPNARASALWAAIEAGDMQQIRTYVDGLRGATRDEPALWLPMAHGLTRLGRTSEAVVWFKLQLQATPHDARLLLDLSDAFALLGRDSIATELRRRAVLQLPQEVNRAVRNPQKTDDDRHLIESAALVMRGQGGIPRADSWMSALLTSRGTAARGSSTSGSTTNAPATSRGEAEVAADWYLGTGRPEHARKIVARSGPEELRKHRLALALVDGDPTQIRTLLADPSPLPPEERAHAFLAIGRERDSMAVMGEELARSPAGADAQAMSEELARLSLFHRPNVRVGGAFEHVTGLDVAGPVIAASHDGLGGRLTYSASASRMVDRSGRLLLRGPRDEAELGALLRILSLRGVTDVSAAIDYQTDTPVGRAGLFDQRQLGRRFTLTSELRAGSRIYDTSYLRVDAVRNSASIGLRYDLTHWYASSEIEGREEHTRRYEHLAWDAVGTAETGVKLLVREPHLSIGAQVQTSQRIYPTRLPDDVYRLVSPNVRLVHMLPPSFHLVGGVVRLARGDVMERSRPDRAPFPRYDCEAGFGALLPDTDTALHFLCGASVRAPGGYTTLLAFYNRGLAGVKNNENAELALSYTVSF